MKWPVARPGFWDNVMTNQVNIRLLNVWLSCVNYYNTFCFLSINDLNVHTITLLGIFVPKTKSTDNNHEGQLVCLGSVVVFLTTWCVGFNSRVGLIIIWKYLFSTSRTHSTKLIITIFNENNTGIYHNSLLSNYLWLPRWRTASVCNCCA